MNFDFGGVLTKAWKITWKYKVLWIFGFFAGFGSWNYNNNSSSREDSSQLSPQDRQMLQPLTDFFNSLNWPVIVMVGLTLLCLFIILAVFLGTIGRIGLIKGASQADAGREPLTFGELWSESLPYFWRMFWLNLLTFLPVLVVIFTSMAGFVVFLMSYADVANSGGPISKFLTLLPVIGGFTSFLCCITLAIAVIQFVVFQGYNAIVLENLGVIEGLTRGWDVVTRNFAPLLLTGVILYIIQFVVGMVIALPIVLIMIPAIVSVIFTGTFGLSITPILFAIACLCIYAPVTWLLGSILETFRQSVWTLTYLRLTVVPSAPPAPQVEPVNG